MKKEFKQTRKIVKNILTDYPQTRNSDALLYVKVVQRLNSSALKKPFWVVMLNLKKMGLPCFETVRRSRQWCQKEFPKLKADDVVQDYRTMLEEEYRKEFGK